jgi:FADH2 O2-dependent halogenase
LPPSFHAHSHEPPYPPEDAAVHHIFDGGWVWVLKFNNGVTSAGVAATEAFADSLRFREGEPAWQRLLSRLPSLGEIFGSARTVVPMVWQPRVSFCSGVLCGRHWVLLPSAAGVVDPLLSTGFPLTLLGLERLGRLLETHWGKASLHDAMLSYACLTASELDTTGQLVGALYATMDRFELFKALTLLYFAAATFSETARRLGKPHLAKAFLLCDKPTFAESVAQICELARQPLSAAQVGTLKRHIRQTIQPFDTAGLTDQSRDPWYAADPADLLVHASKLGASQTEAMAMLKRCGVL